MFFAAIVRSRVILNPAPAQIPGQTRHLGTLVASRPGRTAGARSNQNNIPFILMQSVFGETLENAISDLGANLESYRQQYPGYGVRIITGKVTGQVSRPTVTYDVIEYTNDFPAPAEVPPASQEDLEYAASSDASLAYDEEIA